MVVIKKTKIERGQLTRLVFLGLILVTSRFLPALFALIRPWHKKEPMSFL